MMICSRCLHRASGWHAKFPLPRTFSFTATTRNTPLKDISSTTKPTTPLAQKPLAEIPAAAVSRPESSCPPGTIIKGINYLKGRDDPIALKEEEYPSWLWKILNPKEQASTDDAQDADLFAKSKKLRQKAAKRRRKLEAIRLASGEEIDPKIPLTQQSIDLQSNVEGTIEGAVQAENARKELKAAMRAERKKKIKENNYLRSV